MTKHKTYLVQQRWTQARLEREGGDYWLGSHRKTLVMGLIGYIATSFVLLLFLPLHISVPVFAGGGIILAISLQIAQHQAGKRFYSKVKNKSQPLNMEKLKNAISDN